MTRLVVGTKNPKKLRDMQSILGALGLDVVSIEEICPGMDSPEETGETFDANARIKALAFAEAADSLCIADDSGLEVDALDGAPGVYSSRYAGSDGDDVANNAKLIDAMKDVPQERRGAQFRSVVCLARPGEVLATTEGIVRGQIVDKARGDGGFGYDPHFFHEAFDRTFAECTIEEKATVSHRGQAMRLLADKIERMDLDDAGQAE